MTDRYAEPDAEIARLQGDSGLRAGPFLTCCLATSGRSPAVAKD